MFNWSYYDLHFQFFLNLQTYGQMLGFKAFAGLTKSELHEISDFKRQQVFVVEQDLAYQDADEKDKDSHHLLGYVKGVYICLFI